MEHAFVWTQLSENDTKVAQKQSNNIIAANVRFSSSGITTNYSNVLEWSTKTLFNIIVLRLSYVLIVTLIKNLERPV